MTELARNCRGIRREPAIDSSRIRLSRLTYEVRDTYHLWVRCPDRPARRTGYTFDSRPDRSGPPRTRTVAASAGGDDPRSLVPDDAPRTDPASATRPHRPVDGRRPLTPRRGGIPPARACARDVGRSGPAATRLPVASTPSRARVLLVGPVRGEGCDAARREPQYRPVGTETLGGRGRERGSGSQVRRMRGKQPTGVKRARSAACRPELVPADASALQSEASPDTNRRSILKVPTEGDERPAPREPLRCTPPRAPTPAPACSR